MNKIDVDTLKINQLKMLDFYYGHALYNESTHKFLKELSKKLNKTVVRLDKAKKLKKMQEKVGSKLES